MFCQYIEGFAILKKILFRVTNKNKTSCKAVHRGNLKLIPIILAHMVDTGLESKCYINEKILIPQFFIPLYYNLMAYMTQQYVGR